MSVVRSGCQWTVRAPAKLNLTLEVIGRRGDGYHDVETLMVPISRCDVLRFEVRPQGPIELQAEWAVQPPAGSRGNAEQSLSEVALSEEVRPEGARAELGDLPPPQENLVVRALERLRARAGIAAGAMVRLVKRIPAAAGLGGGSSDAAAALRLGAAAWGVDLTADELAEVAAEVGSDVPFFLQDRAALCRGRGERIEPVPGLAGLHVVVARPPVALSTAEVYAACRPEPSRGAALAVRHALLRGDLAAAAARMHNGLESAAEQLTPWIGRLRGELTRLGCQAVRMSGSGASCFGICRNARHARRVASQLQARRMGVVFAATTSPVGIASRSSLSSPAAAGSQLK